MMASAGWRWQGSELVAATVLWAYSSRQGEGCAGINDVKINNLTEELLVMQRSAVGAAGVRRQSGDVQTALVMGFRLLAEQVEVCAVIGLESTRRSRGPGSRAHY